MRGRRGAGAIGRQRRLVKNLVLGARLKPPTHDIMIVDFGTRNDAKAQGAIMIQPAFLEQIDEALEHLDELDADVQTAA